MGWRFRPSCLLKFSLRTALLAMICTAVVMAWGVNEYGWKKREEEACRRLWRLGAQTTREDVPSDWELPPDDPLSIAESTSLPAEGLPSCLWSGWLYHPIDDIYLEDVEITPEVERDLRVFRALRSLSLIDCANANRLEFGEFPRLEYLQIVDAAITEARLREICELSRLKSLDIANHSNRPISFPSPAKMVNLNSLALKGVDVDIEVMRSIAALPKLSGLYFSWVPCSPAMVEIIATKTQLDALALEGPSVDDAMLMQLDKLIRLKTLSLASTSITNEGLRAIENLPELWSLDLGSTAVSDQGAPTLSRLRGLYDLCLLHTQITTASAPMLTHIPNLSVDLEISAAVKIAKAQQAK